MLRNQLREIEKESSLSGDVYTLRTKLKAMQQEVEAGQKKISTLRNDVRFNAFLLNIRCLFRHSHRVLRFAVRGMWMQFSMLLYVEVISSFTYLKLSLWKCFL